MTRTSRIFALALMVSASAAIADGPAAPLLTGSGWGMQRLTYDKPTEDMPTFGDLQQRSDPEVIDYVLGPLAHAPIAIFSYSGGGSGPIQLIEEWTPVAEGCQRLKWQANFQRDLRARPETARLSSVVATAEIALAGPGGCSDLRPATLGAGVDREEAFRALKLLEEIAAGKTNAAIECKVVAGPATCGNAQDMRAKLLVADHRVIDRFDGGIEVRYGIETHPFLTLKLDLARPQQVSIELRSATRGCQSTVALACGGASAVAANDARLGKKLSAEDDPRHQYDLAYLYLSGQGVPQDSAKALALYRQAAEAGYSPAMLGLAHIYEGGRGIAADKVQSDHWYRRWADSDDGIYTDEYKARTLASLKIQPPSTRNAARR